MISNCPLCENPKTNSFFNYQKGKKIFDYLKCGDCDLVFMERNQLLSPEDEKNRYQNHDNSIKTQGYIEFLNELIDPILNKVESFHEGLDFGSGPYPMLSELVTERGYSISTYDPFFTQDDLALIKKYDFITCCEVVEHFHWPYENFELLWDLLNINGVLGIKTGIVYPEIEFSKWFYKEDETHVAFYSPKTFDWICERFNFRIIHFDKNVILLKKI